MVLIPMRPLERLMRVIAQLELRKIIHYIDVSEATRSCRCLAVYLRLFVDIHLWEYLGGIEGMMGHS